MFIIYFLNKNNLLYCIFYFCYITFLYFYIKICFFICIIHIDYKQDMNKKCDRYTNCISLLLTQEEK
ncbi:MAG: hypothetical protein A2268_07120 [Candidatus Raymondbacteria bacterium RifOxyA12_full_50_37]|nr:MAG: hypothetical protein A2268_07120 [Candidatus Raymondbacteria bacterium RifOxyA12_full_50_37]